MADKRISELNAITGGNTANDDLFLVVDSSTGETKKITRAELNNAIEQDVLASVDITTANIDGGTIDGTTIGGTTAAAGSFTTLDTSGNATIGGDLTVNGTTTTINSTTLDVDDLNITLASGAADAASANGAGLTVDGASATFTYASSGDKWTLNKDLDVAGQIIASGDLTVGTDNLIVNSTGIGIGTSPQKGIHLNENDSEAVILIQSSDTGTAGVYMGDQSDSIVGGIIYDNNTDTLQLRSSNNHTAVTIDSSERVGIGTSSPADTLSVNGQIGLFGNDGQVKFNNGDKISGGNNYGDIRILADRFRVYDRAGSNLAVNIDSSGNVGIGTTSPSYELDVKKSKASSPMTMRVRNDSSTSGAEAALRIEASGNNFFITNYPDADTSNANRTDFGSTAGGSYLTFSPAGAERMRILSGGGITFNGDTATANALDDYEEGTWTPANAGSSSRTGTWDSTLIGTYTKIGRLVQINFNITGTGMGLTAAGGYSYYTGLPFPVVRNATSTWATGAISSYLGGLVWVDTSERLWIYAPQNTSATSNGIDVSVTYYTS